MCQTCLDLINCPAPGRAPRGRPSCQEAVRSWDPRLREMKGPRRGRLAPGEAPSAQPGGPSAVGPDSQPGLGGTAGASWVPGKRRTTGSGSNKRIRGRGGAGAATCLKGAFLEPCARARVLTHTHTHTQPLGLPLMCGN